MKYSTGFLDALFGSRTTITLRQDDGTLARVIVTEAWLKSMEGDKIFSSSGKIGRKVPFHITGPKGSAESQLTVGVDISEERYQTLSDPQTGALYGLLGYKEGSETTTVVDKQTWDEAVRRYGVLGKQIRTKPFIPTEEP